MSDKNQGAQFHIEINSREIGGLVGEETPYFYSPNLRILGDSSQQTSYRTSQKSECDTPLNKDPISVIDYDKNQIDLKTNKAFGITFFNSP